MVGQNGDNELFIKKMGALIFQVVYNLLSYENIIFRITEDVGQLNRKPSVANTNTWTCVEW